MKHAAIRDPAFLDWHEQNAAAILARDPEVVGELVRRNCAIKADVVERDERENGLRAILNYGHTLGHAIEHVAKYELRHGECVALGIVAENAIAVARGLLDAADAARVEKLMGALQLPTRLPTTLLPIIDDAAILAATRLDKKAKAGAVNFVLLEGPGRPIATANIADAEILAALELTR